ncbi:MAG: transporter substrate-binding domain-containing protein [Rhodoferax sp.]|nr:transporter substrate-binding domain-containing protein [Rhodoferax sp.]
MNGLERFIVSVALVLVHAQLGAEPIVLRTAAQEGSAPKFTESQTGIQGHCPDIFRALEKADPLLKVDVAAPSSIKRLETNLKEGRLDIVCALLETPLRNEIAHRISTPLFSVRERVVGRVDETLQIRSLKDLADMGELVATQNGASYTAALRGQGVKVDDSSGDSAVALRKLVNGRVRFYYTNEQTGAYYIHAGGLEGQLRLMPGILQETPSYLWVSRKVDDATLQRLERAVARLHKEGVLDKIYRSYLSKF